MLQSDLQAIRNAFRTPEGRAAILGQIVVLISAMAASIGVTGRILLHPSVIDAMAADSTGQVLLGFHAFTLIIPVLFTMGAGSGYFGQQLFAANHTVLLLTSPISTFRIVTRVFVRSVASWLLIGSAIGLPPLLGATHEAGLPLTSALVYPLALLVFIAPLQGFQLLLRIIAVRWKPGPKLRLLLTSSHVLFCLALGFAVLIGFLDAKELGGQWGQWLNEAPALPTWFVAPASLLNAAIGHPLKIGALVQSLLITLSAIPMLALAAKNYRGAFEASLVVRDEPTFVRRQPSWPESMARSLLRRHWLETVRVRSNVIAYAVMILITIIVMAYASPTSASDSLVPTDLRSGSDLVSSWFGVVLFLCTLLSMSLVGGEQPTIALLATSPLSLSLFLQVKLFILSIPLLSTLIAATVAAPLVGDVSWGAIPFFVASALPMVLGLLGLLSIIGTWPAAVPVHSDVPFGQSLRSTLPVIAIAIFAGAQLYGYLTLRRAVIEGFHGRGPLQSVDPNWLPVLFYASIWLGSLLILILGLRVGRKNLRRLFGAQ